MWGKIIILMYRLSLHGLYGLHGLLMSVVLKKLLNGITHLLPFDNLIQVKQLWLWFWQTISLFYIFDSCFYFCGWELFQYEQLFMTILTCWIMHRKYGLHLQAPAPACENTGIDLWTVSIQKCIIIESETLGNASKWNFATYSMSIFCQKIQSQIWFSNRERLFAGSS